MSTFDLEEQEQIAALKAWWREYGTLVIVAVLAAALAVAGVIGWRTYQSSQAAKASAIYTELRKAAGTRDIKQVRDLAGAILEGHPRTAYAPLAALVSAKAHFESGDLKTARAQLEWVIEHAREPELGAIARLRLVNVLIDEQAFGAALKTLEAQPPAGFAGRYDEARGDVYALQGKTAEARSAYRAALGRLAPQDGASRELLELKLEALGGDGA
ncbi:MAG: tetratricopeptide repeat protein [Burkholderiales bacterium]|nr:tetratricopeptide repeat protein [Burkholderiales bacterium]